MAVKEKTKILPLSEDVTCAIRWPRNIKIGCPMIQASLQICQ